MMKGRQATHGAHCGGESLHKGLGGTGQPCSGEGSCAGSMDVCVPLHLRYEPQTEFQYC